MKKERNPPIKCLVRNLSTGGCLISIPADSMQEIRKRLFNLSPEEVAETLVQNLTDGFSGAEYEEPVSLFNLGDWDIVNGEYRMSGDVGQKNMRKVRERQVQRGRWIPIEYDGFADGSPVYDKWECSECAHEHNGEEDTLTAFCPECGACMRGERKYE